MMGSIRRNADDLGPMNKQAAAQLLAANIIEGITELTLAPQEPPYMT